MNWNVSWSGYLSEYLRLSGSGLLSVYLRVSLEQVEITVVTESRPLELSSLNKEINYQEFEGLQYFFSPAFIN